MTTATGSMRIFGAAVAAALVSGAPALAEGRKTLGFALISSNDDFLAGYTYDRWRTGSITAHLLRGPADAATAQQVAFGDVLEYQFRSEILQPESFDNPAEGERPYAGLLSFGIHAHWREAGYELRAGADLVVVGPQTGLMDFQAELHELQELQNPRDAEDFQIGNSAYLTVSGEAAQRFPLAGRTVVRPFASARIGDETFARVGADIVGGSLATTGFFIRDYATGQLVAATDGPDTGFGWSLGLDVAAVASSAYLPGDGDRPGPSTGRGRVRAGATWAWESWSLFLGGAFLSPEFDDQPEGQYIGTLALTIGF